LGARLHDQPDSALLEELRRKNGTPREFLEQPDLVPRLLPAVRAGYALLETYEHTAEPALPCALSAILGTDDPDLRTEHLEAWSIHTEKSFRLHHFPGDHFFHQDAPEALLALILEDVAAAAAALE
jgi:medium-chain acyl-[acyl-carrier-protein] hydrolase